MKLLHVVVIFVAVWFAMVSAASINEKYYGKSRRGSRSSITKRPAITTARRATRRSTKTTTVNTTATTTSTRAITSSTKATTASTRVTTTSTKATTTPSPSSSTVYSGDGTYYDVGLGSCGINNSNSELVAALNAPQMSNGANPNKNPLCGKSIKVTNPANNKSVVVKIVDTCPPCASGSVDMSPSAFASIADMSLGRIKINWSWV